MTLLPLRSPHLTNLRGGGRYGVLMRDFLKPHSSHGVQLWDISPALLAKQRETLSGFNVSFAECDFLAVGTEALSPFDLVIMNEMIGDLPTITGLQRRDVTGEGIKEHDPLLHDLQRLFNSYAFPREDEPFNFNLGSILALEKICRAGVKRIFISEHSCEASIPPSLVGLVTVSAPGIPEDIALQGHKEYTIKFSYLESLARSFSYRVKRGPLADFIPLNWDAELRVCLKRPAPKTPQEEVIRQFVADLYQYEYLLLTK